MPARVSHKYIRREGSKGAYRYFYADDASHASPAAAQKVGQLDHIKRLIAGRHTGHHEMTPAEISAEVGVPVAKVRQQITNMRTAGRRKKSAPSSGGPVHSDGKDFAHHGHDYDATHIAEAASSAAAGAPSAVTPAPPVARPARARGTAASRARAARRADTAEDTAAMAAASATPAAPETSAAKIKRLRSKLKQGGLDLPGGGSAAKVSAARARTSGPRPARAASTEQAGGVGLTARGKTAISDRLQSLLANHQIPIGQLTPLQSRAEALVNDRDGESMSINLAADTAFGEFKAAGTIVATGRGGGSSDFETAMRAPTSASASTGPGGVATAEARDLSEVEPAFEASERPIREAIETQARGGNPYLDRAKTIYDRIKGDYTTKGRKESVKWMLSAIDNVSGPLTESTVKAAFIEIRNASPEKDGSNAWGKAKAHLESGTFHTIDEVMENPPINLEVERMKRGFAAKQFARMKPYLSNTFTSANPSAPPPFPTWDDLATWSEWKANSGATESPAHATSHGRSQKAHPKEFFDSMTEVGGKKQNPPGWLTLDLAPVWSYVTKEHEGKTDSHGRPVAYAGTRLTGQDVSSRGLGQDLNIRSQSPSGAERATFSESIMEKSLRKYVQMRGGTAQLIDIPAAKLSKIGLDHEKIFKGEMDVREIIKNKIIDPVMLLKVVKEEMKQPVKKSWTLVVPDHLEAVDFKKSHVIDLKKSRIEKVQRLLYARKD